MTQKAASGWLSPVMNVGIHMVGLAQAEVVIKWVIGKLFLSVILSLHWSRGVQYV